MLVQNIGSFKKNTGFSSVIGIGKFDGFHLGHQRIIKNILTISKKICSTPAVFTIKNYPSSCTLMNWEQRIEAFKNAGIEICLWANFSEICHMSYSRFLEKLYSLTDFKAICVGNDFRFGHNRAGNIEHIRNWAEKRGIYVYVVKPVTINGRIVSSTVIKNLISMADFVNAKKMLGKWYGIEGVCIQGRKIGRKIGFPTINLELKNKNIPLTEGVYVCLAKTGNRFYKGVLFYGKSGTFDLPISFEIHVLDADPGNVYKKNFIVFPLKKIRKVRRFRSAEGLVERIKKDYNGNRKIFQSFNLTD